MPGLQLFPSVMTEDSRQRMFLITFSSPTSLIKWISSLKPLLSPSANVFKSSFKANPTTNGLHLLHLNYSPTAKR